MEQKSPLSGEPEGGRIFIDAIFQGDESGRIRHNSA